MPSSTPGPQFDYKEVGDHYSPPSSVLTMPQSLSSASLSHSHQDEVAPLGTSAAAPQPSDALPMISPLDMRPDEPRDIVESSRGIPTFKRWLQTRIRKSNKDPVLHEPDRVPAQPRLATGHQSRSVTSKDGRL